MYRGSLQNCPTMDMEKRYKYQGTRNMKVSKQIKSKQSNNKTYCNHKVESQKRKERIPLKAPQGKEIYHIQRIPKRI
jgi:hypothetical protein